MPDTKAKQSESSDGLAVASLAVGVFAFLLGWTGVFGLPVSVVAIVFGVVALVGKQNKNLAVAGLVLGIVSFLVSAVMLVVAVSNIGNTCSTVTPLSQFQQQQPIVRSFRF